MFGDFWSVETLPCGTPVFVAEMSTWEGYGCPDPMTGVSLASGGRVNIQLEPKYVRDEIGYFIGMAPSGAFLRLFND